MFDIYSANEWSTKKRKDFLCDQLKNWPSLFNFLNQKDFCCMPLPNIYPTMNYDPTEGGLFFYSLEVARTLQNLTTHMSLTWKREESPLLIGLLHAIWILDDYYCVPFGDSQEQLGLLRNESPIYPPGYGDKSLILLMNHIDLTEEENNYYLKISVLIYWQKKKYLLCSFMIPKKKSYSFSSGSMML